MDDFFPSLWFGWIFYFGLIGVLAVASYFDLRYFTIPKALSLVGLVLGLGINLARLVLLKGDDVGWATALGEGFLFSLGGFATGFGIFFALWIMGLCGGGDVKLFAATAAWLGFYYSFWLWVGSVFTMAIVSSVRMMLHTTFKGVDSTKHSFFASGAATPNNPNPRRPRRRLLGYSLPLTIAAVLMLLWFFRENLGLVPSSKLATVPATSAGL